IVDPGVDRLGGQPLPVYNRIPSTFGTDRYVLTNPDVQAMTYVGAEITGQTNLDRLLLMGGLTAGRSEALSSSIGFLPTENDHEALGDVSVNPNSRTYAKGR